MATAVDNRLRSTDVAEVAAMAQMWAATLDQRMTLGEGQRLVVEHYASSTAVVMPAVLNQGYRRKLGNRPGWEAIPQSDPNDVRAYLAELREIRKQGRREIQQQSSQSFADQARARGINLNQIGA
jgi:DNA-binding IclR family transcriptional regulator